MSRVFIVHHQKREIEGKLVEARDVSAAKEYGELTYLLPHEASPFEPDRWLSVMRKNLEGFDREDYLLLLGNPSFIAWAAALASHGAQGQLSLLQWERDLQKYRVVKVNLCDV